MKKEDIPFLNQLAVASEEAFLKLGGDYLKEDAENFNKTKKFILKLQKKIIEITV